jgi:rhamnosyltransferase
MIIQYCEEFRRYFDTRIFHEQNKWLIDDYGKPTGEGIKVCDDRKLAKLRLNKPVQLSIGSNRLASIFAKFLGYKGGGFYNKIPRPLLKKLSMHKLLLEIIFRRHKFDIA